jgi:hypothetical protein
MDFENQKMLESFFNARQTPKLLRSELLGSQAVIDAVKASELDEGFAFDLLAHMILAKRSPVTALIGLLKHHFAGKHDQMQQTADAIKQAVLTDLVDWDPMREQVVLRFDIDQATHDLIRQYQYLPPMVVPPLKVGNQVGRNRGSGYLTIISDSLILRDNHHDGELCADNLNRLVLSLVTTQTIYLFTSLCQKAGARKRPTTTCGRTSLMRKGENAPQSSTRPLSTTGMRTYP